MRSPQLAIAVACALGAVAPSAHALLKADTAAAVPIYVGGSSAAQTALEASFAAYCTPGTIDVYSSGGGGAAAPDFHVVSCTVKAGTYNGTAYSTAFNAALYYHAEGGSAVGAGAVQKNLAVSQLNVTNACAEGTLAGNPTVSSTFIACTVPGFCEWTDSSTTANTLQTATKLDLGFADVECGALIGDNWPWQFTYLNTPVAGPPGQIGKCPATASTAFAQVFYPIVRNDNALTDISHEAITAIISGAITTWDKVPGSGYATAKQITICRRDAGSGTQSTLELEFAGSTGKATSLSVKPDGTYCGNKNNKGVQVLGSAGAPGSVVTTGSTVTIVNETTTQVKNCVTNNPDTIGFVAVQSSLSGSHGLTINGQAGNTVNAALGKYPWVYESTYYTPSAYSASSTTAADITTQMITDASDATAFYTNTGGSPSVVMIAGNGSSGNTPSIALASSASGQQPIALFGRGGNSCGHQASQL